MPENLLMASIYEEDTSEFLSLLSKKAAINTRYDGLTPLMVASQIGVLAIVQRILAEEVDVSEADDDGNTRGRHH